MEKIKTYIESGILELYVLADLSAEERSEVEAMAKLHPEVKAELDEIERVMGVIADNFAVEPSSKVKAHFFNSISFAEDTTSASDLVADEGKGTSEVKVVPVSSKQLSFYKYALAACLALLMVSIVAIINLNNSLKDSKTQVSQLQNSNQSFANRVNYLDQKVAKSKEALNILTDPDFEMVKLKGTANSPKSNLMVAFNPKKQKVMLDLHSMDIPKNDQQHQYQLWALVDGKPVDLGVFDAENKDGMKDMKSIGVAQAFAVTLEPRGGSVAPTMDKMMVMGNI